MELKSMMSTWYTGMAEFKSHLYGIEIDEAELAYKRTVGLNRTFMELKLATTDSHGNAISV